MILFLPPAPHTGAFFDGVRARLDAPSAAGTYPGYGDVPPAGKARIESYAQSLLPQASGKPLIGFHTGCLVAIEMALQRPDIGPLILIDIPYFDAETKAKHSAGLEADNPKHDAFRAAFAYDLDAAFARLDHKVTCIATQSSLLENTCKAAGKIRGALLMKRPDIEKPAFAGEEMAILLRALIS